MAFSGEKWEPSKKQAQFLALPPTIREAAYAGGAGSGKTDILLVYGIIHKWHENPNFKQLFLRRTFPELKNEVVPRAKQLYRRFGATFNATDMIFTFPSGAIVKLWHCQNEDDVHQYDSMEINLFTPDEITSYTEYIYLYIGFTRVRTNDPKLPAIIRTAGMPGGIGHTWFKKRFVDPSPKGGIILKGKGGNKRILVFATQADNPHVDPNYKQSLEALPEAEKRAKLYGDFDAYLGQVFDEFRDRRYPDEPENALHVIEPFDIPSWWPRIVIGDWGFAAMTWIGYAAISPTRRVIVYREQWWRKTKIEEWVPFVREFVDLENPRIIKFCKSAGQDRGQEHTIQEQIETALGRQIELSNNSPGSRIAGKVLIHEYLRWKPKHQPTLESKEYNEEYAQWILRNRTVEEYKAYLNSFNPLIPENNLPKLQIFSDCPVLINAIKSASYAKSKDGIPAEDIAQFDGDDPLDGLRYIVDTADAYFDEASNEYKTLQSREQLVQRLEQDKDWTAFYRNNLTLDSRENRIVSVPRFRR